MNTGSGGDNIDNTAYSTNDEIHSNAGNDYIATGAGDDVIYAGGGVDSLLGGEGDDLLIGGSGNDWVDLGTGGVDRVVLDVKQGTDTVIGFESGSDIVSIRQTIPVGDADAKIENGVVINSGGGFSTDAELIIVTGDYDGVLSAEVAATLIGSANSTYSSDQHALFAVDNGTDSQLYYFTSSSGNDATVSASELTLLATLSGTASTALSDYAFSL